MRRAKIEADLEVGAFPTAAASLWLAFHRLSGRRGASGFGVVDPISFAEIEAFTRLSGTSLTPWEIEQIEMLDDIYRTEQAKAAKK